MDGWLDATTSCTKFVDLLYTFLDYFHSDAGTLGVLFDMMKSQPPTCKVQFQQQLNELTNNSPMMDIVYEEINDLDYIKTLLDCILMYCSNLYYMTTSICIQTKIANPPAYRQKLPIHSLKKNYTENYGCLWRNIE